MDVCSIRQAMSELKWTCTSCKSSLHEVQCSIFLLQWVPFTQTVLFLNSWSLISWCIHKCKIGDMPVDCYVKNSEKIIECSPCPIPLQITYTHYIKCYMHLPDLSNGECRTSNKCDHSELFSLEIQRNDNSWFSIFSGKHRQHYFDYCNFSTNGVPVDCSVGLFFQRKMEEKIVQ